MAFKYVPSIGQITPVQINQGAKVFKVQPNQPTRWYIFNAGPNDGVAFHFIGTYQNDSYGFNATRTHNYPHGHLMKQDMNDQVNWIPPADGQVIEAKFPLIDHTNSHNPLVNASGYVGVDHNMNHVIKGAAFAVLATNAARPGDQPQGTWVPPIDPSHRLPLCVSSEQQGERVCGATPLAAVANATK
jgi:nitrite reductase (NO-forming)